MPLKKPDQFNETKSINNIMKFGVLEWPVIDHLDLFVCVYVFTWSLLYRLSWSKINTNELR